MQRSALVILLAAATAAADPAIETYTAKAFSVTIPKGWKALKDTGAALVVQAPTHAKDAPILMIAYQASGVTDSADEQLTKVATGLAKDIKIKERGPLPDGHGQALIGDGTMGGMAVRIAAIAIAEHGGGTVAVLAAKSSDFDAVGGAQLVLQVVSSVKPLPPAQPARATPSPPPPPPPPQPRKAPVLLDDVSRGTKRTGQPDLADDRRALASDRLQRTWERGSIVEIPPLPHGGDGRTESHSEAERFIFGSDGKYSLYTLFKSDHKDCTRVLSMTELGTYKFDGRTLVMTATSAEMSQSNCNKPAEKAKYKTLPGPRTYQVGLTDDGYLVMLGPACGAAVDINCPDRARWEMKSAP